MYCVSITKDIKKAIFIFAFFLIYVYPAPWKKDIYVNQGKTPVQKISQLFRHFFLYIGGCDAVVAIAGIQFF